MQKKVLVIGLDGATFTVLKPWMDDGTLPNMRTIATQGVSGVLLSTIPPVTGPAWASFMTGKAPGNHGVYDFLRPSKTKMIREAVNYNTIKSETLFSILTKYGKKVCSVNMPLTYPLPKVNGCIISGLLTPKNSHFTYPDSLLDELQTVIGKYIMDVRWQRYGEHEVKKFLKRLTFCTEQRIKASFYLMDRFNWDFFMIVFTGTDRIQHFLWDYISKDRSINHNVKHAKKFRDLIIDYYKMLDDTIGRYISKIVDNTVLIVMSDHGFGPLKGKIYINNWLEKMGYLSYDSEKLSVFTSRTSHKTLLKRIVKRFDRLNIIGNLAARFGKSATGMRAYEFLNCIDWLHTKAYAASNTEQGIYINLKGREPSGIVRHDEYETLREDIMNKLRTLCHPLTGEKIVSDIYKREEIYEGQYLKDAPDIVFFLSNGEYLADVQPAKKLFEVKNWRTGSGTHRSEGIFIAYGTDIKHGISINNARIIDIAPTVLTMLGVPIPNDMEGSVLNAIFESEYFQNNPPKYVDVGELIEKSDRIYSDEETADIQESLKDLGYL